MDLVIKTYERRGLRARRLHGKFKDWLLRRIKEGFANAGPAAAAVILAGFGRSTSSPQA